MKALQWLKANNPLYADIQIADNWVESAIADNEELLTSMLEQPECMDTTESVPANVPEKCVSSEVTVLTNIPIIDSIDDPVSHYANVLESFVRQHGLAVHDVPADGNCLFSSVAYQLQNTGKLVDVVTLRQVIVRYLFDHSEFYSPLVHQPVATNDVYNADNEAPDSEDAYIEAILDPDTQKLLRWQKYLRGLSHGAWGDSIVIAMEVYCGQN